MVRNATNAHSAQPAITVANGTAVPLLNALTRLPDAAPSTNCSVPMSADAEPAIAPYGLIASAVVFGPTKP